MEKVDLLFSGYGKCQACLKSGKVWLVQPGLHPGKSWFNQAFGERVNILLCHKDLQKINGFHDLNL